ncbi:MAG: prepilin-type N-terminal cleavage/methylation domain-containing protein, partial [Raoultibacter sp.]
MNEMIKKVRGDKKGFTLAELLIVVAIILVLVAIAIPLFTNATASANKAVASADIRVAKSEALAMSLQPTGGPAFYTAAISKDGDVTMTKSATGTVTEYADVLKAVEAKNTVTVTVQVKADGSVTGGTTPAP